MWPFSDQKRLKTLEESLERIERAFKTLQLEWDNTYEKFRQLNMRISKRVQKMEQLEEASDAVPTPESNSNGGQPTSGLSPAAVRAQMSVIARRKRMGGT